MGRCGSQQPLGCRRVEMSWKEGDPSALGDPSPRLDLTSNGQTSSGNQGGVGWDGDPLGMAVSVQYVPCTGDRIAHPLVAISEGKCRELSARDGDAGAAWPGGTFGPQFWRLLWSMEQEQQPHRIWVWFNHYRGSRKS